MKRFLSFALLILSAGMLAAQTTRIVATAIVGADNGPLLNGKITWQPTDINGNPLNVNRGTTGGLVLPRPAYCLIANGAITTALNGSNCTVIDTTVTNAANFCYKVTIVDAVSGWTAPVMPCVQPSGSTWSLDTYVPSGSQTQMVNGTVDATARAAAASAQSTANSALSTANAALPLAGGTMTGPIVLPGNPSANLQAATKQYVDNATSSGVRSINSVAGAFTFSGSGVSCSSTTCTFSGSSGGIGSITFSLPSWLTPSPATLSASGTETISAAAGQTSHQVLGTCGTATRVGLCSLAAGDLPSSLVYTGQSNTYGAYLQDFSGATIKLPVAAGYSSTANGNIGYDSTNKNWHIWQNGVDKLLIPIATGFVSGDCGEPTNSGGTWTYADAGGPCGVSSGGVTAVSGDGALLTNSGSTGGVTLTLGTAASHKWWGNNTGSTGTPGYQSIGISDLPSGIPNANLANASATVNGQTCTLGSTCTIPIQTNGTGNTSQAGVNFSTSTANADGLIVTPINSSANVEKMEVSGTYSGSISSSQVTSGLGYTPANCTPGTSGSNCLQLSGGYIPTSVIAAGQTRRACIIDNDTQSATALTAAEFSGKCVIPSAGTIVEVDVQGGTQVLNGTAAAPTFTGTSSIQIGKYGTSSNTALLSAALATTSGHACALTTTSGGCLFNNGMTSSSTVTISTTALAAGDTLYVSDATADGTQTWYTIAIIYTVN